MPRLELIRCKLSQHFVPACFHRRLPLPNLRARIPILVAEFSRRIDQVDDHLYVRGVRIQSLEDDDRAREFLFRAE